jgi:hypothetical protein
LNQQQWQPTGLEIALQWSQLPPEHFQAALKAIEPQLVREHEYRMALLHTETQRLKERRALIRHLTGLGAGFVIAAGMLVGAAILGVKGQPWLAGVLTGPSVFALVKIFVLRQATTDDLKRLRQSQIMPQIATPTPEPELGSSP